MRTAPLLLTALLWSAAQAAVPELTVLQQQFDKAKAERVSSAFETAMSQLRARYLGAVDRSIASMKSAGDAAGVVALEEEKKLIGESRSLPPDDKRTHAALLSLRPIFRTEAAKLADQQRVNEAALLKPMIATLNQLEATLSKAERLDEAKVVAAYRISLETPPSKAVTSPVAPGHVPKWATALSHFDLQIPVVNGGGVLELKTLITKPDEGFSDAPSYGSFCWALGDQALVFRVPPNGATTPNSHFPRTELSQKKQERWTPSSGDHRLRGSFSITSVPDVTEKGEMTIIQIHDDVSDNGPLFKLVCAYDSKPWKLHTEYRVEPKKNSLQIKTPKPMRKTVVEGKPMDFEVVLSAASVLTVKIREVGDQAWQTLADSSERGQALDAAWSGETCYFKVGCYLFDPSAKDTPVGEVHFGALTVD